MPETDTSSHLFRHSSGWTRGPVDLDLPAHELALVHGGEGGLGLGVLLELHEAVGIIAGLSDDLTSLDLPNLAEDGQYEVLGHVVVQVAHVQSLRRPAVISPATHFCFLKTELTSESWLVFLVHGVW